MSNKKPYVLIVEDNPGDIELIRLAFRELDCDINFRIFQDGEDALSFLIHSKLDHSAFDLMILDINLPGLNGLEILKELQSREIKMPIVVFSSFQSTEYQDQVFALGVEEYCVKPTSTQEYFRIVQSFSRYW